MFNICDIKSPDFLKQLNTDELKILCDEIRKFILEKVSSSGGHLSANLGVVELTVALHYVFNSPVDKFIFDVGHQVYTHKILTGRSEGFDKLRTQDGISGFPKYSESVHDAFEVGHSSTSLSAMCGFIEARKAGKEIGEIISIIGDGSIQNGLALSALNYLDSLKNKEKVIIILNDNNMSISKNVGGLANRFNKIRINKSYNKFKSKFPNWLKKIFRPFKRAITSIVYKQNNIFSEYNFKYIGPIDGHNICELIRYFSFAKKYNEPIMLHLKTTKGKGYKPAEEDKIGYFHGIGKFDLETGMLEKKTDDNIKSYSYLVTKAINEHLDNENIRLITPGMVYGTDLINIDSKHYHKIIDVGIQEENAVVMASGMSLHGLIPFVFTYSTFIQRAYDEIVHDVLRSKSHVVFMLDRAGIVPGDGDTHQGIFDVSMLLPLPNIIISAPSNYSEIKDLIALSIENKSPFVIRYPKGNVDVRRASNKVLEIGKWNVLKEVSDINIITYGNYVNTFYDKLTGKNVGLINALFIKPLDFEVLEKLKNKTVIVYEDVIRNSSLGTEIILYNHTHDLNMNIIHYAVDDFVNTGTFEELIDKNNLNIDHIIKENKINEV